MEPNALNLKSRNYVSDSGKKLIWETFFQSKQRGVSLSAHFPWLDESNGLITCLTIEYDTKESNPSLAALTIIKRQNITNIVDIGLVGLVCVDTAYRKQGLSTKLMQEAKIQAEKQGLSALVLWTSLPAVYEKVGFMIDEQDLYGVVNCAATSKEAPTKSHTENNDIAQKNLNDVGLPAFAEEVIQYSRNGASIKICRAKDVITLAEWEGEISDILKLIDYSMPKSWKINVKPEDPLIEALISCGYQMSLSPGAVRMVLKISPTFNKSIPYINILHRI